MLSGLEPAAPRPQTPTPRHPLRARERGELGGSVSRRLRATKRLGFMDLRGNDDSLAPPSLRSASGRTGGLRAFGQ